MSSSTVVLLVVLLWFACGLYAAKIAGSRGSANPLWASLGLLFGPLAVLAIFLGFSAQSSAPEGMVRVRCARCDAVQNASAKSAEYECWRCHTVCVIKP